MDYVTATVEVAASPVKELRRAPLPAHKFVLTPEYLDWLAADRATVDHLRASQQIFPLLPHPGAIRLSD
jgi:hypothetical protein